MSELARSRTLVRAALFGLALAIASTADGAQKPVALGEVTTRVAPHGEPIDGVFRSTLQHELDHLPLGNVRARDRFILSATLLRMDVASRSDASTATCVVSATLRRAKGGDLHAIIRGRAKAVDGPRRARDAELSALKGAVHSALAHVPEAIER